LEQLGAYEDQEFEFWCHAILHLKHYGMSRLYKHNLINEKGEDLNRVKIATKKEKEEKRATIPARESMRALGRKVSLPHEQDLLCEHTPR